MSAGCCDTHKQSNNPQRWAQGRNLERRHVGPLRRGFEQGAARMRSQVRQLARLSLAPGFDIFGAVRGLDWQEFEVPVTRGFSQSSAGAFQGANTAELRRLRIPIQRAKVSDDFQRELALSYVEQFGLNKATALTEVTQRSVRQVIERGLRDRVGVDSMLGDIEATIGLTPRQSGQLLDRLERRRLEGLTRAELDRWVDRERKRLIRLRAETIMRTETNEARNEGVLQAWQIGQQEGLLDPTLWKAWISNGACPICREIVLQGPVPIRQPFFSPMQDQFFQRPPAHPNCRCSMGLVDPPERR